MTCTQGTFICIIRHYMQGIHKASMRTACSTLLAQYQPGWAVGWHIASAEKRAADSGCKEAA